MFAPLDTGRDHLHPSILDGIIRTHVLLDNLHDSQDQRQMI